MHWAGGPAQGRPRRGCARRRDAQGAPAPAVEGQRRLGRGPGRWHRRAPRPDEARTLVIEGRKAESLTEESRSWVQFAADPPAAARTAVDDFDPDRTALC